MTRMIDILEDYCQYRGYGYCRIDGNTSGEDRESQVGAERLMPDAGCWLMWALGGGAPGGGAGAYTAACLAGAHSNCCYAAPAATHTHNTD